jgi:hypothetical protein
VDDLSPKAFEDNIYWLRSCINGPDRSYQVWRISGDREFETLSEFSTGFPVGPLAVDGDTIVAAYGSRICESIIGLQPRGFEPMHVEVVGPGGSFNTGGDIRDDCDHMGISEHPTIWNDRLAFLASTVALQHAGSSRLDQPMDAFLVDDEGGESVRVSLELFDAGDLEWLDQDTLVASGARPSTVPQTILVNVETGAIKVILPFAARSLAMSPDGTRVAALRTIPEGNVSDEVVTFPRSMLAP